MNDVLFHGIAIIALLVGNVMFIALGFMAARLYLNTSNAEPEQEGFSSLRQDVKSVTFSLAAMNERLAKLELQIGQLRESADKQGSSLGRDSDQKSFKIATKLALQGANVDEIVELCGLARGEAELIRMLHANNQVSPSGLSDHDPPPPSKRPARVIDFSGVNSALKPD
jgi:hypothetical protein